MKFNQGTLENIILNAVWNMEELETGEENLVDVASVKDRINLENQQNWAYTTVKTVMDRLVEKSFVDRYKVGKKYYYKSTISRDFFGNEAIKKVAKQYYNGNLEDMARSVNKLLNETYAFVR